MRLALWQTASPAGDTTAGLASLASALRTAGAAGAATLVTPEVFLPGYNHARIAALAQRRGGDWHRAAAGLCREAGCGLVLGYAERDGAAVFNAAAAFDATGAEIAHYRKIQLYGPREKALYAPGEAYATFDLDGSRAAILICYDIEFAPHVAALAAQGVRLILVPTGNMLPFTHVSTATVPAMAANHGCAIAYANCCGSEGDLTYAGGSVLAGPDGAILAIAGGAPALIIAELPATTDRARLSTQAADFRPVTAQGASR
ncbi:MAG: nitrilase [Alphaproteobacteria bacterium HGW-Alphaproteobacteria-6]|nr:MAG: nitrilase [Alphaproteobacteria bacterium HGW-Alphaproteobacteria-6]